MERVGTIFKRKEGITIVSSEHTCEMCQKKRGQLDAKEITLSSVKGAEVKMVLCKRCRENLAAEFIREEEDKQADKRTLREQRAELSRDELLRALWLLDEYVDAFGWHSTDSAKGGELPSKYTATHGYWCKMNDGSYKHLQFDSKGFYEVIAGRKVYVTKGCVVAWQGLHEVATY